MKEMEASMASQKRVPRDKTLDATLSLLSDGYEFIGKRCRKYNSDIFQTRLLGKRMVCISGEEAARIFYDSTRFQREGVLPHRIKASLFGEGGVQTLDGDAHQQRKELFLSVAVQEKRKELLNLTEEQWRQSIQKWQSMETVVLFDEVQELICRAVCSWAAVPLKEQEARKRAQDFSLMIDSFGAVGSRHRRGRRARKRTEKWIRGIINAIRDGKLYVPEDSVAHQVAFYKDMDGNLLPIKVAAVELINILRPTVALEYFITFAAVALHEHPEYLPRLQEDDTFVEFFVQEVRRYFPFAPFMGAHTLQEIIWKGYTIPKGRMVLLDLYGTDHDDRIWEEPDQFRPERFQKWHDNAYNFIPQGGGEVTGHRCPGEWTTIEELNLAVKFLAREITYEVPPQNLYISLKRMPTMPESKFLMRGVKVVSHSIREKTSQQV
jgi:fatty-acid peroxygenase